MKRGVDYIGVGVGAVIINREGKVFAAKRGREAKNERGLWEFPGGSVEFGDTLEDTIKREVREGVKEGVPKIMEPHKCDDIGWFALEEISRMPITIVTKGNIKNISKHRQKRRCPLLSLRIAGR